MLQFVLFISSFIILWSIRCKCNSKLMDLVTSRFAWRLGRKNIYQIFKLVFRRNGKKMWFHFHSMQAKVAAKKLCAKHFPFIYAYCWDRNIVIVSLAEQILHTWPTLKRIEFSVVHSKLLCHNGNFKKPIK